MLLASRLQIRNNGIFSNVFAGLISNRRFVFGEKADARSEYQRWKDKSRVKKLFLRSAVLGILFLKYRDHITRPAIDKQLYNLRLVARKIDDKIDHLNEGLDDLKDALVRTVKYMLNHGNLNEPDPRIRQQLNGTPWKIVRRKDLPLLPDRKDLDFPPNLPTLILDIDTVLAKVQYNRLYGWRVTKRPFAQAFLKDLLFHYEVVIWSKFEYPIAQSLVTQWGLPVMGTLHKENCDKGSDQTYVKNLTRLGRDLSRVVVVDSDRSALEFHPDNLVLVEPFDGKLPSKDNELEVLHLYLKELSSKHGDLRTVINETGQTKEQRQKVVENMKNRDRYVRDFAALACLASFAFPECDSTQFCALDFRRNCRVILKVRPSRLADDDETTDNPPLSWDNGTPNITDEPLTRLVFNDMNRVYQFDRVLPPNTSQETCYDVCCGELIQPFVSGFNCSLLAYGQTGSGKTYTMGTQIGRKQRDQIGIIPRALQTLFCALKNEEEQGWTVVTSLTFIEIYNEEVRDLLNPQSNETSTRYSGAQDKNVKTTIPLKITKTSSSNQVTLVGVKRLSASSSVDAIEALTSGTLYRTTGSNKLNMTSSRSHAIFTVHLTKEKKEVDGKILRIESRFDFVDLAGSERIKKTQAQGSRLREGITINSGLLALSNVINALTEESGPNESSCHVPYRDSKLTRLLQDSLGGNSQTVLIACVAPNREDFAETFSTVKYATRARFIKNSPVVNKDPQSMLVDALKNEVALLKCQLEELKVQKSVNDPNSHHIQQDPASFLGVEVQNLRKLLLLRDQRESEERANRIAVEAKLLSVKARYQSLIAEVKASYGVAPSKNEEPEHDSIDGLLNSEDEFEEEAKATLSRISEQDLKHVMEHIAIQRDVFESLWKNQGDAKKIQNSLVDYVKGLMNKLDTNTNGDNSLCAASNDDKENDPSNDPTNCPWNGIMEALCKELNLSQSAVRSLIQNASEEEQSRLLCIADSLEGYSDAADSLKSQLERISHNIQSTTTLIDRTMQEKMHWDNMFADVSSRIERLRSKWSATENQKKFLRAKVEELEDTSEQVGMEIRTTEHNPPPPVIAEREAGLQLGKLQKNLEEVGQKKESSRLRIQQYEQSLNRYCDERHVITKKIHEQEKRFRQNLAEKDKLIQRLEKRAKKTGDELSKEKCESATLRKRNEELNRKLQSLQPPSVVSARQRISNSGCFNSKSRTSSKLSIVRLDQTQLIRGAFETLVKLKGRKIKQNNVVERLQSKLARIEEEIQTITKELRGDGVDDDTGGIPRSPSILYDRLEILRSEKEVYSQEVQRELQNSTKTSSEDPDGFGATNVARTQMKSQADLFLDVIVDYAARVLMDAQRILKDLRRKETELQDVRTLNEESAFRERVLVADLKKKHMELMLESNNDKLIFMEGIKWSMNEAKDVTKGKHCRAKRARSEEIQFSEEIQPESLLGSTVINPETSCELTVSSDNHDNCRKASDPNAEMNTGYLKDKQCPSRKGRSTLDPDRPTLPCEGEERTEQDFVVTKTEESNNFTVDEEATRCLDNLEPSRKRFAEINEPQIDGDPFDRNSGQEHSGMIKCIVDVRPAHNDYITACCSDAKVVPQSSFLATGSFNELKVWDTNRLGDHESLTDTYCWREKGLFTSATNFIGSLAFAQERLLCAGVGPIVKLFDVREKNVVHSWVYAPPGDVDSEVLPIVNSITVFSSNDGQYLCVSGSDKMIRVFDLRKRGVLPLCKVPTSEDVSCLEYIPIFLDRKLIHQEEQENKSNMLNGLFCGGDQGVIRLWQEGWSYLPSLSNLGNIRSLLSTPLRMTHDIPKSGEIWSLLACSDRDNRLRAWFWESGRNKPQLVVGEELEKKKDEIAAPLDSSPVDSEQSMCSMMDPCPDEDTDKSNLTQVEYLADRNLCITGDSNGQLRIWKIDDKSENLNKTIHLSTPLIGVVTLPLPSQAEKANTTLTVMDPQYALRELDSSNTFHSWKRKINGLAVSPSGGDSTLIFSVADDTNIKAWKIT